MNKKMFLSVFFILFISINSAFAGNLSSHLERLYKLQDDENKYLQFAKQSNLEIIEDRVVVTVLANQGITTANIDENNLTASGVRIQAKAKHSMRVEIPISALNDVSNALTGLGQITPPIKPEEHAVTSEGVDSMNADEWQSSGYEGSGVKVAIIDGGFDSLTEAQVAGDMPLTYHSYDFEGSGLQTTTPHGTAVTEAIYDLAPDAEFYLYKIADLTDFENAIDSCISNGVDIVNHSMGWFNAGGYYDGTGYICDHVNTALSNGILWVNSAGNYAQQHYRETFSAYAPGLYHDFGSGDTINPIGSYTDVEYIRIVMNWDDYDAYNQSNEDYDLYLVRETTPSNWVKVDSSINRQDGTYPPQETINILAPTDGTYGIMVREFSTSINADFTIFNLDKNLHYNIESSSLADPGTITNVVTVGAINRNAYTSGPQEPFSSQGPTTDGRMKPDVAAPDNCISHAFGYWYGTSLASPHTAGVCALIKSRFPAYNNGQVRTYLYDSCTVDLDPPGKDSVYGYGKVVMPDIFIDVTSPNGGEEWEVDSTYNITWTSSGISGDVYIEYSTNNGFNWTEVIASTANDGTHPWTIPNTSSVNCLVRISDTDRSPSDVSDAVFTIDSTYITITSPNGGEIWYVDSTYDITWDSYGTSDELFIQYSADNGSTWWPVDIEISPSPGSYSWTIPDNPSNTCLVIVADSAILTPSDTSDAVFEIATAPYIEISTPNGGETWKVDSTYNITWTSFNTSGNVHIEYSINNGTDWTDVIASTPDNGTHPWTITEELSDDCDSCLVRISDTDDSPSDVSDVVFTIFPNPYITITAPNGGEIWHVDSTYVITWSSYGTTGSVNLEYSIDNGATWLDVNESRPDTGAYSWTVPNTPSEDCLIRISDIDGEPSDTSDAVFSISLTPYITITAPNGGEEWYIDSTYNITWNSGFTTGGVSIEYSTDSGTSWSDIITSMPDTGVYPWQIPNTPTTTCLVSITDTNGSLSDTSDATFTITAPVPVPFAKIPTVYSMDIRTVTTGNKLEIKYGLPKRTDVVFEIYDIKGTRIKEISENNTAGFHSKEIDISINPAGVYFIKIEAKVENFTKLTKFILVK